MKTKIIKGLECTLVSSSNTAEGLKQTIAKFYYGKPENFELNNIDETDFNPESFYDANTYAVTQNGKRMSGVVKIERGRYKYYLIQKV